MFIRKAVITSAGLGTRLLPTTKEMPKEMLPLFSWSVNGKPLLKPVLQLIFEQLYAAGLREFCFVVGRGKRSVEDHFTPDYSYVDFLRKKGKLSYADELDAFYRKVESSCILWVNQPEPKGFGDAVLNAESFVEDKPFLVHAGDVCLISKENAHIKHLLNYFMSRKISALLTLKAVHDPRKIYGYAVVVSTDGTLKVKQVVEKPEKPPSNLAIMPIYVFDSEIFDAIRQIKPGVGNEVQLTDAIQKLLELQRPIEAVKLTEDVVRLDVGTPETYWEALKISFELSLKRSS